MEDTTCYIRSAQKSSDLIDKAKTPEEFTEKLCKGLGLIPKDLPSWIVIDWEATWKECLQFEVYYEEKIEQGEQVLYFYVLPDRN